MSVISRVIKLVYAVLCVSTTSGVRRDTRETATKELGQPRSPISRDPPLTSF